MDVVAERAVPPAVLTELARPSDFEAVAASASDARRSQRRSCAPTDAEPIVAAIDRFVGAGYDTVILHQIGPDQQRLADLGAASCSATTASRIDDDDRSDAPTCV